MKLSDQAVLVMALALQKSLVMNLDFGKFLQDFDIEVNSQGELSITNFDIARMTKEDLKRVEELEEPN